MPPAYIGAIVGIIARALFPYLVKMRRTQESFDFRKYIWPIIGGLGLSLISAHFIFLQLPPTAGYLAGFTAGWGLQDVSREIQKALVGP